MSMSGIQAQVTQGDFGVALPASLTERDSDGNVTVVDLTGSTLKFNLSTMSYENMWSQTGEIIGDPTEGNCCYTTIEGDFDLPPGFYLLEVEVTFTGPTKVLSYGPTKITVRGQCG